MKIEEYTKRYTKGNPITSRYLFGEIKELWVEILNMNKKGVKEEFQDLLHFFQMWLYWKFGLNGKIWRITQSSVDKFMKRRQVWNEIYKYVGLKEDISGYSGNYMKVEKVIFHLGEFGISKDKAEESYREVILNLEEILIK